MPATWSSRRVVIEASPIAENVGRVGWAGEATPRGVRGSIDGDEVLLATPASLVVVAADEEGVQGGIAGARAAMEAVAARWFAQAHVAEVLLVPAAVAALAAAGRATGLAVTGCGGVCFVAAVVDQQLVFRSAALRVHDEAAVARALHAADAALGPHHARPLPVVNAAAPRAAVPADAFADVAFPHGADAPWIGASILASLPHAPRSSGAPSRALASVFLTKAIYLSNGRRAVPEPRAS